MIITKDLSELNKAKAELNIGFNDLGFVPTMGALHKGHITLIKRAKAENKAAICSIFVNPTQFNDKKDLDNYPRTLESDIVALEASGCDLLFLPSVATMYPDGEKFLDVDLNGLDKTMEGEFRPGHFLGMITIVDKLLKTVNAANNYFGEKDFQQLAIIKHYVLKNNLPFNIVGCETIREADGLAFSSRNALLTADERAVAPLIYKTLCQCNELKGEKSVSSLLAWVKEQIDNSMLLKVQYISFVDAETLVPVHDWDESKNIRACIAVLTSGPRLIDNIAI